MTRAQEFGIPDALGAYGVHLFARHWVGGTLPLGGRRVVGGQGEPGAQADLVPAALLPRSRSRPIVIGRVRPGWGQR